jgi:chorismate synthase
VLWQDFVMLRWLTAGESHGPALMATIEGLPAGVQISTSDVATALARRRLGFGRGARMMLEKDAVEFLGGVRHGVSIGSPLAIRIANSEWAKWQVVMSPDPVAADAAPDALAAAGDVGAPQELARNQPLTRPRPGHADLVGMQKYGFQDARPVLERASARETAARVALGAVASAFLRQAFEITLVSHTVAIGTAGVGPDAELPRADQVQALDGDPVRTLDPVASAAMVAEVEAAKKDGDTLGGVVEVLAYGLPPGLGSYVHWDRRLDSLLAAALMGIQAIKGVEIGDGFVTASRRGSGAHDEIDRDSEGVIRRRTGRAGGTEGGMSTGDVLRVRAAMKPISTVPRSLATVDLATGQAATAIHQRSDVCAVPAAGVVAEAMVALVLAQACLEKFGGDSVAETSRNHRGYLDAIPKSLRTW